jgi:hypothetical protein
MVESKEVTTLDELGAAGNQLSNPLQHRIIVLTSLEIRDVGGGFPAAFVSRLPETQ